MHEPTDACYDQHCFSHHQDEDATGAYLVCGECFHVYRTPGELRRAYRCAFWTIENPWARPSLAWRVWRVLTIRAKRIYFCQYCIHDF